MIKARMWLHLLALWLLLGAHAHAGTVTYVYTDPQGTPLAEADAGGNITARFDYTPYGVSVPSMGAAPTGVGYTGHVNDPETGLVYMRARYYDAEVGRFLSVDPVTAAENPAAAFNRYWYANNNPTRFTDPDGRQPQNTCDDVCQIQRQYDRDFGRESRQTRGAKAVADNASAVGDVIEASYEAAIPIPTVKLGLLGRAGKFFTGLFRAEGTAVQMSRLVASEFGVVGKATRNGSGTVFKLADGKVTVRVMESGGGRSNYLRVSVEGKGSVDVTGKLSSDAAATHIPIDKDSIRLIGDVVERYTE